MESVRSKERRGGAEKPQLKVTGRQAMPREILRRNPAEQAEQGTDVTISQNGALKANSDFRFETRPVARFVK